MDEFNIYEELKIDVSVTDAGAVCQAIHKKILQINKDPNPTRKLSNAEKVKLLTQFEKKIKEDPSVLLKHATAYPEIARRKTAELRDKIQTKGGLLVSNGYISQANLKGLASEFKIDEAEILRLLNAQVLKEEKASINDDGGKELDIQTMNRISGCLNVLGNRTVYEFLKLPAVASLSDINSVLKNIGNWVLGNSNKQDPKVNATDALVKLCNSVFATEESRRSYDKALANTGFVPVREAIQSLKSSGFIHSDQYQRMLQLCTRNGIPKDKAAELITQTAKQLNIAVDKGITSTLLLCRFCGELNSKDTTYCKGCGMPVVIKCPKCGETVGNDEYRHHCGFSVIDMQQAPLRIKTARTLLDAGDVSRAVDEFKAASGYWPNHPELDALNKEIISKDKILKTVATEVAGYCKEKKFYTAAAAAKKLPTSNASRIQAEKAISEADSFLKQASMTNDANRQFDLYLKALNICTDCSIAQIKLDSMSLPVPDGLTVRPLLKSVSLKWNACQSEMLSYTIVRKAGSKPTGPKDGEVLATIKGEMYDDVTAKGGVSYYYGVFSCFGQRNSVKGDISTQPALITLPIEPHKIKVNPSATQLDISIDSAGKYAVEIKRDDGSPTIICGTTFCDRNLQTGQSYRYSFTAIYTDVTGKKHRSDATILDYTPMPKPQPVALHAREEGNQVCLSWKKPSVGTLSIYYSGEPFRYNPNDVVSVEALLANRLNVVGETCRVNKDFTGERYYMPVTVQSNVGVVGKAIAITSLRQVSDPSVILGDNSVNISWKWDELKAVRISYSIDGRLNRTLDIERANNTIPKYEIAITKGSKSISVGVAALVKTQSKTLVGPKFSKVLVLKPAKVNFNNVNNVKKLGFLSTDSYELDFTTDSILPCALHVLISEGIPPMNVNCYSPIAVVKPNDIEVGKNNQIRVTYRRKNSKAPLYFRLIVSDRNLSTSIAIISEVKELK